MPRKVSKGWKGDIESQELRDGETADEFRNRIRDSGQWGEFVELREKLQAEGKTKSQAWNEAAKTFGWVKGLTRVMDLDRYAGPIKKAMEGKESSKREDAEWVYKHIGKRELSRAELCAAPSIGALGLLRWARANQDKFYTQVFSKLQQSKVSDDGGVNTDGDEQISLINELLKVSVSASGSQGVGGKSGVAEKPAGIGEG